MEEGTLGWDLEEPVEKPGPTRITCVSWAQDPKDLKRCWISFICVQSQDSICTLGTTH